MGEILTISIPKRDKVNIDGKEYELKTSDEFSFRYLMKLSAMGERLKVIDSNKLEGQGQIEKYLTSIIKKILIAPGKIKKLLNFKNKFEIVNFFLQQKKKRDQAMLKFN